MMTRTLPALAVVLALTVQAAHAESFPQGDPFRPLVADPLETRTFLSVIDTHFEPHRTTVGSVGVGASFGFYRWPGERPLETWQFGMFAHVASQFDLKGVSYPLLNTDYRVGLALSFQRDALSGRAKVLHQSSHLGDEFILQGNAPARENLSVELVDATLAWEHAGWRPYVGGSYVFHSEPSDLKRVGVQAGLEYARSDPALLGGRPVAALDYRAHAETGWQAGLSAKLGLQFGPQEPQRRGITVFLEYYDGPAPFGQFYHDVISYIGLGLQFHH